MEPQPTSTPINSQENILPNYQQILEEMGRQLSLRKTALLKRVLLIVWPFLLLIVCGYLFQDAIDWEALSQAQQINAIIIGAIYILLSVIYSVIVRFVFQIEKHIWVDSYFDQKNLSLDESWGIAKKLFWPAFVFRLKLWLRFYFVPILIVIVANGAAIFLLAQNTSTYESVVFASVAGFIIFIIALVIYGYYIKTKLRYTWFLFLDKFGIENSFGHHVDEMNRLNSISKSETFRRALLINLGTDSIKAVADMAIGSISLGLGQLGNMGKMVGDLVQVYSQEMNRQATELGNISAQYILYRFARKEAFGEEQKVNENIYNLK